MFDTMGQILTQMMEIPADEVRAWNTKLASGDNSALHEAYIAGFFKHANAEEYIATSELGAQLGTEIALNIKNALKRG